MGDSGPALAGLSQMFNNPEGYGGLPYKHNYTKSGDYALTGFFIPAFTFVSIEGYIDNRGVTNTVKAKNWYEVQRQKLLSDPKEYAIKCAEWCFNPDEALALEGDNDFDTAILQEQLSTIVLHKLGPKPETGFLEYTFKNSEHKTENINGFKWLRDPNGKVKILEHPLKDENGNPYRNLYVAGIDSIDLGSDETSEGTNDPSQFCIVIKKRIRGLELPQYVAMYKDRPRDIREAYRIALRLLEYYNCKAVLEKSKVSFKMWLKERGKDSFLMRRPKATYPDAQFRPNSKDWGSPATKEIIRHQLDLIAAYVSDYGSEIWFVEILDELLRYSYANKRKFDIVASLGRHMPTYIVIYK